MSKYKQQDINLKVAKEEREGDKILLGIAAAPDLVSKIVEGAAYSLAMQNKIDLTDLGPIESIEKVRGVVGEAMFTEFAKDYAMRSLVPFAVTQENVNAIMEPQEFKVYKELILGNEFGFTTIVNLKPTFELTSYEPVTITIAPVTVTEEEVNLQIVLLAERNVTYEEDEGAEVVPDGDLILTFESKFKDTGSPVDYLTAENRVYTLGKDWLPSQFDEHLIGMKAGETKTFDFELPGIPGAEGPLGESYQITSTVSVLEVSKKVIPAINDAWVQEFEPELGNYEGLREKIRSQGIKFKTRQQETDKQYSVLEKLTERLEDTIDAELIEYSGREVLNNLQMQMQQQGIRFEQYLQQVNMDEQTFVTNVMTQAHETLKESLALDALARHLKLSVEDDDYEAILQIMAPEHEEEALEGILETGYLYRLREDALRAKASKWLMDTAVVEVAELAEPEEPTESAEQGE